MESSAVRRLSPLAHDAEKKGIKILHLNIGQPDIRTPENFFEAVKNFHEPVLKYSSSQGMWELIKSFVKYYKKYEIELSEDEIMITNGGSEAILFALMTVADYGDNVLVPEPFYTNYKIIAQIAGVEMNPFLTTAEKGFHLPSQQEIEKHINNRTKAILLSSPGNPTGVVYTSGEIKLIADLAIKHDLFIIADEVYREFVYDNLKHSSFMKIKGIEDRLILVDSISKRYSSCGARIGLIASRNKTLMPSILKLCQSRLCISTLDQVGAASLVDTPDEYFAVVKEEYEKRRDVVFNALMEMDGVICEKPSGAFYIIAKLPVADAEDFCKWLLVHFSINNETVMLAPANGFYATEGLGKSEVRISYCINIDDLHKAMNIIKNGLIKYKKIEK